MQGCRRLDYHLARLKARRLATRISSDPWQQQHQQQHQQQQQQQQLQNLLQLIGVLGRETNPSTFICWLGGTYPSEGLQ
ncbi:hypothetical protein ACSSS7_005904 [Eimeria intestinalis]